jgi:hypothetical protein
VTGIYPVDSRIDLSRIPESTDARFCGFRRPGAAFIALGHAMPLYFFRIRNGSLSGASDQGKEFADHDAAWKELTSVCAGIVGGISRKLQQNSEWEMELLDEAKRPVFRIRLVAETPN